MNVLDILKLVITQGVVCSGIAYYAQGVVLREQGPVFVTAFSPLCMIITAALGSFLLAEKVHLGRYYYRITPSISPALHNLPLLIHTYNKIKTLNCLYLLLPLCWWFQHNRNRYHNLWTLHCPVGKKQRSAKLNNGRR